MLHCYDDGKPCKIKSGIVFQIWIWIYTRIDMHTCICMHVLFRAWIRVCNVPLSITCWTAHNSHAICIASIDFPATTLANEYTIIISKHLLSWLSAAVSHFAWPTGIPYAIYDDLINSQQPRIEPRDICDDANAHIPMVLSPPCRDRVLIKRNYQYNPIKSFFWRRTFTNYDKKWNAIVPNFIIYMHIYTYIHIFTYIGSG